LRDSALLVVAGGALLPTRRGSQQLRPVFGGDGHKPPHLGLVGRLLRRGRNGQLRTQDLSDEQAIELMVGMVRCAAGVGPG
jgi:hypothetical protein